MSDTATVTVRQTYLDNGTNSFVDHAPPAWVVPVPAQCEGPRRCIVPTGGITIAVGTFVTVQNLLVRNRDTTNVLEVAWTYTSTTGTHTNVLPVQPGAAISINGPINSSIVFTALVATINCDFSLIGT